MTVVPTSRARDVVLAGRNVGERSSWDAATFLDGSVVYQGVLKAPVVVPVAAGVGKGASAFWTDLCHVGRVSGAFL